MPFIALDKNTAERVDITKYKEPKKELSAFDLVCQDCHTAMYIRHTINVSAHFAHHPRTDGERCLSAGESPAHMEAKKAMALRMRALYPEARHELEFSITGTEHAESRRVDLLTIWEDGLAYAHEIQLSPISLKELAERTEDYANRGINVIWWLGSKANTYENRDYLISEVGSYGTIRYEGREVSPSSIVS